MGISRISKAIAEVRHDERFQDAEDVRNKDIDVFLPAQLCDSLRQMAQTATALLLRCFKGQIRIHFATPDSILQPVLEAEAKKMDAAKRLEFGANEAGPWRLGLGCAIDGGVIADASGWTARINGVFDTRISAAAPAITFAVSCAVAKLFNKAIFGVDKNWSETWDFCLLRFLAGSHSPLGEKTNAELGRIALLGAGAIGSAVAFVLRLSKWMARLEIVDFDIFEDPNLETCISADVVDVMRPLHKGLSLAGTFQAHPIDAKYRECKIQKDDPILAERWDTFICGVDNGPTRLILDDINARNLLNAGLGGTRHDVGWVLWTHHGLGGPTLSSIYSDSEDVAEMAHVPEEFREECSRKNYNGVSLALPFVALAAGSLLTASLYQNTAGSPTKINCLRIDLFGKQQRLTVS
jgi:hypothetical protein